MIAYLVKKEGQNSGQFYTTREEAEEKAGYLNDIPDGVTYAVQEVEVW